jgi:CRISPR-associated protein Csh1
MKGLKEIAEEKQPWSAYFLELFQLLSRKSLFHIDTPFQPKKGETLLDVAMERINQAGERGTILFAVRDQKGRLPGEVEIYRRYLMENLINEKYVTAKAPPIEEKTCKLCGTKKTTLYPNAWMGAGLNILNVDRQGAFPNLNLKEAWKTFALCACCADLLFIFKNHLSKNYGALIAGDWALIIPHLSGEIKEKKTLQQRLQKYIATLDQTQTKEQGKKKEKKGSVGIIEDRLLRFLSQDSVVGSLSYIWAEQGQYIGDISGLFTDILPSRLAQLTKLHEEIQKSEKALIGTSLWSHPIFPIHTRGQERYDLSMSILQKLFRRPGGNASKKINESMRLAQLRRDLLGALLYKRSLSPARFWQEWQLTAEAYFQEALKNGFFLFQEWIRHIAMFLFYLRTEGVFAMEEIHYIPKEESLRAFFTEASGISSLPKAYAFLLGILYGKLVQVQAARQVNVNANALTWLKHLSLQGKDLIDLYNKIHKKLFEYGTFQNSKVRSISEEVSYIGTKIGSNISLDQTQTCYFLLLGKALSQDILKKEDSPTAPSE